MCEICVLICVKFLFFICLNTRILTWQNDLQNKRLQQREMLLLKARAFRKRKEEEDKQAAAAREAMKRESE